MTVEKRTEHFIDLDLTYSAHNYAPLPVVLTRGKGVFVYDIEGRRYFDMLSAYSALNQGHQHPKILSAAKRQLGRLALTSRAFHNDRMGPFLQRLCRVAKTDKALPMNSGAEAVETAIKAMRLWGYRTKGIAKNKAEIIVAAENFHGRTTTIVGFSTDSGASDDFGPSMPGFKVIPYNDVKALERAITKNTCGFLIEPIQGEAGVIIPARGYLKKVAALCRKRKVLLCADEIQTGLGRTGALFCVDHEGVKPDLMTLGKALSGGMYPVSALVGRKEVLGLFQPGSHGSTYGGNPLASAIGLAALDVIVKEKLPQKAKTMGTYFLKRLTKLKHPLISTVRGAGLMLAIEFSEPIAKDFCKILMRKGVLAKDTHQTTVRFAPPLVITRSQVDAAFKKIEAALKEV
jgi:ornithine--oxo-acid transaminase